MGDFKSVGSAGLAALVGADFEGVMVLELRKCSTHPLGFAHVLLAVMDGWMLYLGSLVNVILLIVFTAQARAWRSLA
jgi:hypothetical protein